MRVNRKIKSRLNFEKKKSFSKKLNFGKYLIPFLVVLAVSFGVYSLISWYQERYKHYIEVYNNFTPSFAPGDNEMVRKMIDLDNSFNIAAIGLDRKDEGLIKSDMVVIAHYDSISRIFQIFELPTKTLYYWPSKEDYVTLGNVYALGQLESPASGMDSLIEVLEYNLALNIDSYAALDILGLEGFVDKMSTIVVHNEYAFEDNDLQQLGLRSSFDLGKVRFNKKEDVSAFVMSDEGGFAKTSKRRYSVIESLSGVININSIYKTIADFDNIESHLFSNVDPNSMRSMISTLLDREDDYLVFLNLPDISKSITFLDEGITVFDTVKFDEFILSSIGNSDIEREQARIEIFNSTDVPNLASSYSRTLKNLGCDVIRTSNNDGDFEKTILFVPEITKFPSTIKRITDSFDSEIQIVSESPQFPTTGDIVIVISYDLVK